ncbi:MAG: sulfurtransferase [Nitrospinaceae bacterium]
MTAVLTAGFLAFCVYPAWAQEVKSSALGITPLQLQKIRSGPVVVLDSRSSLQYYWGHIPGARHLGDWKQYTVTINGVPGLLNRDPRFLAEKLANLGLSRSQTLVIYGDAKDPWRTDGRFFWMFEFLGFQHVLMLNGGYAAWTRADLEVERGNVADFAPTPWNPGDIRFNAAANADQTWILQHLHTPDLVILDNREAKEYHGATPFGAVRGGRIPGAIHLNWKEFFDPQGALKSLPNLQQILDRYGIREGKTIVVYCTGGVRSGSNR